MQDKLAKENRREKNVFEEIMFKNDLNVCKTSFYTNTRLRKNQVGIKRKNQQQQQKKTNTTGTT